MKRKILSSSSIKTKLTQAKHNRDEPEIQSYNDETYMYNIV